MYSRYPNRQDRPIRIPEHYSGCAFSSSPPKEEPAEPVSAPPPLYLPLPDADTPAVRSEPHTEVKPSPTEASPLPAPLPDGLDFEEFLLFGLIFLLSRSDGNSDMILWLMLLLFSK